MNVLALTLTFSVQLSFSGASHFFCSTLTIKTHHSGLRLEVECGCDNERWEWEMNVFCSTILLTFSVQLDIIYPSLVEGASHFFCSNSNIIEYLGCYSLQRNGKTLDIMLLWLGWTENHVFIPSVWYQRAVDHFDEPVPRSRLRGHSEKNTDDSHFLWGDVATLDQFHHQPTTSCNGRPGCYATNINIYSELKA